MNSGFRDSSEIDATKRQNAEAVKVGSIAAALPTEAASLFLISWAAFFSRLGGFIAIFMAPRAKQDKLRASKQFCSVPGCVSARWEDVTTSYHKFPAH